MTRLRSLRSRTVAAGVVVVALVLAGLDAFVYLSLRHELEENVEALLQERVELAGNLADDHGPVELADRLQALGIRATVTLPDGTRLAGNPASPALSSGLPPPAAGERPTDAAASLDLPDASRVTVFASRAGAEQTLDQMAFLLVTGTLLGVGLAGLLLRQWSTRELRPLEDFMRAAHRVAAGERGVRLQPARTDTEVGQVSLAFDEVTAALEAAIAEARAMGELNQAFLADAAHQLRTPVTAIRAAAEVLGMDLDADDRRRALDLLVGQSARVGSLLTGLLRLARLDSGERPAQELVDLETVCRTEVERFRQLHPHLAVDLRGGLGSATPIELDPAAMTEALANLLDNACRHAAGRVEVRVAVAGSTIEVAVSDDGAGIPAAQVDRAFARFVSLDDGEGSGLGLPIARAIVEAHGGTLEYDGRAFVIRLALERRHRPRLAVIGGCSPELHGGGTLQDVAATSMSLSGSRPTGSG